MIQDHAIVLEDCGGRTRAWAMHAHFSFVCKQRSRRLVAAKIE
jgi:hypothetical protein